MREKTFGWELNLDLYNCNPEKIKNRKIIYNYIKQLCDDILKVKRFGKPLLKRYGHEHLTGYSLVQLIEASSIVGHFSEEKSSAYIDIFSCAHFNRKNVAEFTKKYFEAKYYTNNFIIRK